MAPMLRLLALSIQLNAVKLLTSCRWFLNFLFSGRDVLEWLIVGWRAILSPHHGLACRGFLEMQKSDTDAWCSSSHRRTTVNNDDSLVFRFPLSTQFCFLLCRAPMQLVNLRARNTYETVCFHWVVRDGWSLHKELQSPIKEIHKAINLSKLSIVC